MRSEMTSPVTHDLSDCWHKWLLTWVREFLAKLSHFFSNQIQMEIREEDMLDFDDEDRYALPPPGSQYRQQPKNDNHSNIVFGTLLLSKEYDGALIKINTEDICGKGCFSTAYKGTMHPIERKESAHLPAAHKEQIEVCVKIFNQEIDLRLLQKMIIDFGCMLVTVESF